MDEIEINVEEEKNIVGGVDRLVIWIGLAVLALLPTLFTVLFQPWKAAPLLAGEHPEGRNGYILGPGVFFVVAIAVLIIVSGMIDSPDEDDITAPATVVETQVAEDDASNTPASPFATGYEIGRELRRNAEEAEAEDGQENDEDADGFSFRNQFEIGLSEGNVIAAATGISPFFLMGCVIAGLTALSGKLVGIPEWTLRASVGAGLYSITSMTVWFVVGIESSQLFFSGAEQGAVRGSLTWLLLAVWAPIFLIPWQTFWFVKHYTGTSAHNSGLVAATTFGLAFAGIICVSIIMLMIGFTEIRERDTSPQTPSAVEAVAADETATPPSIPVPSDAPPE